MTGFDPALMFITDPGIGTAADIEACVAAALKGGATSIQLRDKAASDADLIALARRLKALTQAVGVPLIVNDRVAVVEPADADGLHVGNDDMPPAEARRRLAPGRLLGLSVTSRTEALAVDPAQIDYAGVGPVFATPTKADAAPPVGLDGLADIANLLAAPIVAIGGIGIGNAQAVARSGAHGVAVISAIAFAADPVAAAAAIRAAVERGRAPAPA